MTSLLAKHRKSLHQIPEVGFQEFKTKAYILEQVTSLNCTIHHAGETGLILYFDYHQEEAIAFRADMDALAIEEETNLSFTSQHKGYMHACGHDGHMAILLGLAQYLNNPSEKPSKNVVLIFQPSEEKEAGARIIMESGLLDHYNVQAVFGLHLWPNLKKGEIFSRPKELMSRASEVTITVHGKASHVASSRLGIDALQIACRLMTDIYEMEQSLPLETYRLVKFGEMHAGNVRNILAAKATISGSIRSFDEEVHTYLKNQLQTLAEAYDKQYGCQIHIAYNDGYDAVLNDEVLFNSINCKIPSIHTLDEPVMQSEDFGIYCKNYPSVFFFLGLGDTPPLHNERFDFDMEVLDKGLNFFINLLQKGI